LNVPFEQFNSSARYNPYAICRRALLFGVVGICMSLRG